MMPLKIRRTVCFIDEQPTADGVAGDPLRKVGVAAIVGNPFAGRRADDLSALIEGSVAVGRMIATRAAELILPYRVESYAKGAIVGIGGEAEHAEAVLTTPFGDTLREAAGGGKAWISHCAKQGAAGTAIDIPLAHKDALFVRSHYDVMTLCVPDAPHPDEIVIFCCFANRGRLSHRIGGLRVEDISAHDGLR
jgi:hypothetical protein